MVCNDIWWDLAEVYQISPRNLAQNLPHLLHCNRFLATALHKSHSYFIHRQLCFHLSKRIVAHKDADCDKVSGSSLHLQKRIFKSFAFVRTEEIMPPLSIKQLSSFSQACHFVHQNMGHLVRLWVYNCHCFQLADQSERTLGLGLWQCTKYFHQP